MITKQSFAGLAMMGGALVVEWEPPGVQSRANDGLQTRLRYLND